MRTKRMYEMMVSAVFLVWSGLCPAEMSTEITGPAHGQWGREIECNVALRATSDQVGRLVWRLTPRGKPQRIAEGMGAEAVRIVPNHTTAQRISIPLPAVSQPSGRTDGDYDIHFLWHPAGGKATLPLAPRHPIHIETRDRFGRIDGVYQPRNTDLFAANSWPGEILPEWLTQTGIRHGRRNVSWGEFEPQKGQWNPKAFEQLERIILKANQYNMTTLPILAGCPDWAAEDGKGGWVPPKNAADFEAFAKKVVEHFSQPPYNQQYWQIWNEAPAQPFWPKDIPLKVYIERIHIPAARAIRAHYVDLNGNGKREDGEGCRVVWGGWPADQWKGGQYAEALELLDAGAYTDFLDAHYMQGLRWFTYRAWSGDVYDRWVVRAKVLGCWQTEMGWTFAEDPTWMPITFFQDIGWALEHNWNFKEKYRDYFFHYWSSGKGFFWDGHRQWPNGFAIRTLMRVTRGDLALPGSGRTISSTGGTAAYESVDVQHSEKHRRLQPILAGGRLVFLFMPEEGKDQATAEFTVRLKPGEKVQSVRKISLIRGNEMRLPFEQKDKVLHFRLPWKKVHPIPEEIDLPHSPHVYVSIECKTPMTPWE